MDGFRSWFFKDESALYNFIQIALSNPPSVKIDGKPALVVWSDFEGLEGPGVGFKSLIGQLQKGAPRDYFTNTQDLHDYIQSKGMDPSEGVRREESFRKALEQIAPLVEPGYMLWGDVLFYDSAEFAPNCECEPNTIRYRFSPEVFDCKGKDFGICIHTVLTENFVRESVLDANSYLTDKPAKTFLLSPVDIQCSVNQQLLDSARAAANKAHEFCRTFEIKDEVRKAIAYFSKKGITDIQQIATRAKVEPQVVQDTLDALAIYEVANDSIVDAYNTKGIQTFMNGLESSGEGLVYTDSSGQAIKFVKDEFTNTNKLHMMRGER